MYIALPLSHIKTMYTSVLQQRSLVIRRRNKPRKPKMKNGHYLVVSFTSGERTGSHDSRYPVSMFLTWGREPILLCQSKGAFNQLFFSFFLWNLNSFQFYSSSIFHFHFSFFISHFPFFFYIFYRPFSIFHSSFSFSIFHFHFPASIFFLMFFSVLKIVSSPRQGTISQHR